MMEKQVQCGKIDSKKIENVDRRKQLCPYFISAAQEPDVHLARIFVWKGP